MVSMRTTYLANAQEQLRARAIGQIRSPFAPPRKVALSDGLRLRGNPVERPELVLTSSKDCGRSSLLRRHLCEETGSKNSNAESRPGSSTAVDDLKKRVSDSASFASRNAEPLVLH